MDIFFQDPNEIPLPPNEVRIRELRAEPKADGRRVRVYLEVDPTQKRPSAELTIRDSVGNPCAKASIIESMTRRMELTMHLRGEEPIGVYNLEAVLFFQSPPPEPGEQGGEVKLPPALVVDQHQIQFELPNQPAA
jgi:hypothetical protein